jgi:hypothetical protein
MVSLVKGPYFYRGFFIYICIMNINEIYKTVAYMVDKFQGTYLSPDDFNLAVNAAQRQYLNFLTGETAEFNQGVRRTAAGGFSNDVTTGGSLSNFLKESDLTITSQLSPQPTDFYKISAMRTTDNDYPVRRVGADKIYAYVNNPIDAPTASDPIYTEIGLNFKFWPSTLATAKIVYFKKPADAVWAYYVDDSGNAVYVPTGGTVPSGKTLIPSTGSVQLEWPENDHMDIIYRTLGIIGINLKDGDLIRVSQTVKNDGQ